MATLIGTKLQNVTDGKILDPGTWGSTVLVQVDSYTGTPGASDKIKLCSLPKNARVLRGSRVVFAALGGSCAATIGTETSASKFAGSTSMATAGEALLTANGSKLGEDTSVVVTFSAAAASSGTVTATIFYTVAG